MNRPGLGSEKNVASIQSVQILKCEQCSPKAPNIAFETTDVICLNAKSPEECVV